MLIDAIEYKRRLKQLIESNEKRFEEIEKQLPNCGRLFDMAKNLAEREGLLLAMRILTDMMMEKGEHDAGN